MDQYGTTIDFKTYHTARGRVVDSFADAAIAAALLVASECLDARYQSKFPGFKVGQRAQLREWPRTGGIDIYGYSIPANSIPTEIVNAVYELALRQLQVPGSLSIDWTPNKYRRASVDGAVAVEYNTFSSSTDVQTQFNIVDEILGPILTANDISPLSGGSFR
jgi:hypothetical protein